MEQSFKTETYYSTKRIMKKMPFTPDVIVVLFMTKFITFKNLFELNNITNAPIFLYMPDMATFTGGCHYSWDVKVILKIAEIVRVCFQTTQMTRQIFICNLRMNMLNKTNIIPIAGSEYQNRQLNESSLFKNKKKYKILLSIREDIFKPKDKYEVRRTLNIPIEKKILFFGSVSSYEKRKGFRELIEALEILKNSLNNKEIENLYLVIAGDSKEEFEKLVNISHTFLGLLPQNQLPTVYQAADIFICPSIEDSGPMMINQSIMCGTPVVSFEMGVALDLVITGQTGYRAKLKDSVDLAKE